MISLTVADPVGLRWAQRQVLAHHYLHTMVDPRCRPLAYELWVADSSCEYRIGCLIFGRPEATRCYVGGLTYGSQEDVAAGRAQYDRWSVLNLARVWIHPAAQQGEPDYRPFYTPKVLPGYTDRRGVFRSTLASHAIRLALACVGYDYLHAHPPVDCAYPYQISAVLSYCDTRRHKGTIYRASGFSLARTNGRGIETWWTSAVTPLTADPDRADGDTGAVAMTTAPGIRLFVGGHCGRVQGEPQDLGGDRMFTAAHRPERVTHARPVCGIVDSGAYTDVMEDRRLTVAAALDRQLAWERVASEKWGAPFRAERFVSYDRLIDEKWTGEKRQKRRWTVRDGESAVEESITAAQYLAAQRATLAPRRLILSLQGVDAYQYQECAAEVLKLATADDWIGLGGWCILGMRKSYLPTFWQALRLVLPMIAASGARHIHIFGVMYEVALGGLLWLADQYKLSVSTDSTKPVLACTWKDWKKAGVRRPYWRDNVAWWLEALANLRQSEYYKAPPAIAPTRQESFL